MRKRDRVEGDVAEAVELPVRLLRKTRNSPKRGTGRLSTSTWLRPPVTYCFLHCDPCCLFICGIALFPVKQMVSHRVLAHGHSGALRRLRHLTFSLFLLMRRFVLFLFSLL